MISLYFLIPMPYYKCPPEIFVRNCFTALPASLKNRMSDVRDEISMNDTFSLKACAGGNAVLVVRRRWESEQLQAHKRYIIDRANPSLILLVYFVCTMLHCTTRLPSW
jgi:hypothetical protein